MKKAVALSIVVIFISVQLMGCSTPLTTREKGAGSGGIIGAILGGIIGHQVGSAAAGAAIGAAIGLAGGYLVGQWAEDRQVKERAEVAREENYKREQGMALKLQGGDIAPTLANPGDNVNARVVYSVLGPDPEEKIKIAETRFVRKDGKDFGTSRREVEYSQGQYESSYQFVLPKTISDGAYTVVTTLEIVNGQAYQQHISHLNFIVRGQESPRTVNP